MESMTVKKLIELLTALSEEDQEKEVYTEGCDCTGDVGSLEVDPSAVTILRRKH